MAQYIYVWTDKSKKVGLSSHAADNYIIPKSFMDPLKFITMLCFYIQNEIIILLKLVLEEGMYNNTNIYSRIE